MRSRTLIIALSLVGAFVLFTARPDLLPRPLAEKLNRPGTNLTNWSGPTVARSAGLGSDEANNIDIYKNARNATVFITSTVYQRNFFSEMVPSRGTGSGFIISDDGKILTNNHVISGSSKLQVTLEGGDQYDAQVLARDRQNDLALISVRPRKKLPILRLGDSDPLQVGQKVLAIGNPFGLEGSLTVGVVSSLGRSLKDENGRTLEGMVQTDAAINPGNSGGPLLDSQGNVIGINTAIYGQSNMGIGFAMPINRAKAMLNDLRAGRSVGTPRLGVGVQYVRGDLAEALDLPSEGGLLVQEIVPDSPAAEAGLRGPTQAVRIGNANLFVGGDLIMAVEGRAVDRTDAIRRAMDKKRPGDTLTLTVFRNNRRLEIRATLDESPE